MLTNPNEIVPLQIGRGATSASFPAEEPRKPPILPSSSRTPTVHTTHTWRG